MKMTAEEVDFYLGMVLLFKNVNQISRELGVARLTVIGWQNHAPLPNARYRGTLVGLLDDLIEELHNSTPAARRVADWLSRLPEPSKPKEPHPLETWLKDILAEGPQRGNEVINLLERRGFRRVAIQQMATAIGVTKTPVGSGPGSYSMWELNHEAE